MSTDEEIISAALSLPPGTRAMLAEHLLESLDTEDQRRIDALWADEAERRDKEIEDGTVTPIPGEEVMNRLRARYKRRTTPFILTRRRNSKRSRVTTTAFVKSWVIDFALKLEWQSRESSTFPTPGSGCPKTLAAVH